MANLDFLEQRQVWKYESMEVWKWNKYINN